jgi:hypothetical protein
MTPRRWRVLLAARRAAARWMQREYVLGVGIGLRHCQGRWCEDAGIVIKVDWKLGEERLRQERRSSLPRWIEVVVDGKRARVAVDLQETAGERAGTLQGVVGAPVSHDGRPIGSVSAIVIANGARAALISGHVAKEPGRRLKLGDVAGRTAEPIITKRLDHCLVELEPSATAAVDSFVDGSDLAGVRAVSTLQMGQTLYFHRMATGERIPLILRHVEMSAPFETEDGVVTMQGMIVTNGRTMRGDSGALLHDDAFRAVGTLVGSFAGESYFIPCDYAFAAMGLQLA